jgi:hypothetical protein
MRPTVKLQLLRSAKASSNEGGFAIPIVIGMGLIMILLATTSILRSQNDGVAAISKGAKDQSIAVADLKVAQVQAFLNKYRAAALKSSAEWASATTANLPTANAACIAPADLATSVAAINSMAGTAWTDVDSADPSKGQYRLISYTADGQITVAGRTNVGKSSEATSQVVVTVPLFTTDTEQVAGIWVKTRLEGSPTMKSDVMGPCTGTLTASFPSSGAGSDRAILRTRQTMPSALPAPTSSKYDLTTLVGLSNQQLPRTGDIADAADGVYKYIVPSIDSSFKIEPGKKVYIWVTGNINLENKVIVNQCSATTGTPPTLVNPDCGPFDVRIYGTATASPTLTLNQTGTAVCDVFFHLPNYSATFNTGGTANSQDCGGGAKNTGVYWVDRWSSGTGTSLDANRGTWSQAWENLALPTPPPRIGPLIGWDSRQAS